MHFNISTSGGASSDLARSRYAASANAWYAFGLCAGYLETAWLVDGSLEAGLEHACMHG